MSTTVVPGNSRRVHALRPYDWAVTAATDYWATFGSVLGIPGGAGEEDLDLYGWVTSGFSHTVGSGADFLTSVDVGVTGGVNMNAANDFLLSPFIFGDFAHGEMVKGLLGHAPTRLNMECFARFAANADESASGFGFVEAGATGQFAEGDLLAFVTSDATNFTLVSGEPDTGAGSTDNTTAHLFKITINKGTTLAIDWFIDGVQQTSMDLQEDLWPAAFAINTEATGTNDPVVSWVHIWYE